MPNPIKKISRLSSLHLLLLKSSLSHLIKAGVRLGQVVHLVVDPGNFERHLAHSANGDTIAAGGEE